ncbi:MAG TPA: protein kinase, partial [Vicinamibacterales bacterium]|nr:protein kinase [Vicinamibacterales bacterium]
MSLTSGTRIGVFEIATQIGEGGMGQVYRAFDTKLKRQVAIKILPASLAADHERLARFQREAEVLASLNHPNIAGIYGLEEGGAATALVMELVEGEDLSARIARGAIPLDEALLIATQIAAGLEAAHGQGIIHRDLKPANIKVRPDGAVKVLDFGLAKAVEPPASSPSVTQSPTITSPAMTGAGVILGTAAYMAPEQAKGKAVDKRADIWAFGSVLYEMLTARRAFEGDDITDTIVAVVSKEPDWSRLPLATPWGVRRLLTRCLEKDPKRRYHEVADVRLDLEDAMATPGPAAAPVARPGARLGVTAAAVAVTALTTAAIVWAFGVAAPASPAAGSGISRFMIEPAEPMPENEGFLIFSRDGRRVAYAAGPAGRQRLFVRDVDQFSSKPVPETEGVVSATFSPDGQSIAFIAERKLRSVTLAGGAPLTLRERVDGAGLSWTADQMILFSPGTATGIWRVPATGGNPAEVTRPGASDNEQRFPELLPNGKGVLFNARGGVTDDMVYVESLETHERRAIVRGLAPHYLPTGHLAFVRAGTLFAIAFDAERLEAKGEPVTLLEGIRQVRTGQPLIGYSDAGSVVYVPAAADPGANALVWVNRDGVETPAVAAGRLYAQPRLSPDGRRVVTSLRGNAEDLWLIDLERGTSSRLTAES